DFWLKVAKSPAGTQHNWEEVFANYTAAVDNPASCVWRELVAAYPDAKVILTLHAKGANAWYESTMSTIYRFGHMWQVTLLGLFVPRMRKFSEMTRKLVWERAHRGEMQDRTKAIAQYERQIDEVKKAVPDNRLLIFSADQGWEPLCKFLGVPVPTDPFPNVNDRATMQKMIAVLTAIGYGIVTVSIFFVVAVIYAVARFLK
ncbi:MAG TPA: sulfotransferase, partial [Steroidobacteraceae bacterium]|nr:sulfotransferase [Steroidobacteraceae bacterium]